MKVMPYLPTQRARTLFVTALILACGALLDLPLARNARADSLLIPTLLVIVLVSFGVMWLATRGWTQAGGMILSGMIFVGIAVSVSPDSLLNGPAGTALIFPILISGLVLGATAVLIFGALGLAAIALTPLLSGAAWGSGTALIMAIVLLSTILLWVTINLLQRNLREAERQRTAAEAAEARSAAAAASLQQTLTNLEQRTFEITQLYETVNNLEIPVIPLIDGVIVAPLVGHLDSQRMERLADRVLETIHSQRIKLILIDITGVPVFDTAVAQRLATLTAAVQLIGARVILTGIRVETAITITSLGITFESIKTFGRLQQGIELVLSGNAKHN